MLHRKIIVGFSDPHKTQKCILLAERKFFCVQPGGTTYVHTTGTPTACTAHLSNLRPAEFYYVMFIEVFL